jgi:hypothetical protein
LAISLLACALSDVYFAIAVEFSETDAKTLMQYLANFLTLLGTCGPLDLNKRCFAIMLIANA